MSTCGFTRITVDTLINEGETLLYGLIPLASGGAGVVTIYEGNDPVSGKILFLVNCLDVLTFPLIFPTPIYIDRGLYINLGANIASVTVLWKPALHEEYERSDYGTT